MKPFPRQEIPDGYAYYRTHSKAYFDYEMRGADMQKISIIDEKEGYGSIRHFFG
jgi:hypothetical protein